MVKVSPGSILHYDIDIVFVSKDFEEFDYMGMIEATENRYFRRGFPGGMFLDAICSTFMEDMCIFFIANTSLLLIF